MAQKQRLPNVIKPLIQEMVINLRNQPEIAHWKANSFEDNPQFASLTPVKKCATIAIVFRRISAEAPETFLKEQAQLWDAAKTCESESENVILLQSSLTLAQLVLPNSNFFKGLDIGDGFKYVYTTISSCLALLGIFTSADARKFCPSDFRDDPLQLCTNVIGYILTTLHKRPDLADALSSAAQSGEGAWAQYITLILDATADRIRDTEDDYSGLVHGNISALRAVLAIKRTSNRPFSVVERRHVLAANATTSRTFETRMGND